MPDRPGLDPRSPGLDPRSPGLDPRSPGLDPRSPGLDPRSPGLDPRSPGLDPRSPGLDPRSPGLDPRTKIIAVIAVSAAVMSTGGARFLAAGLLLGVGLAVWERAWRRAVVLPLAVGVLAAGAFWLPLVKPHPALGAIATGSLLAVRFAVALGVGLHLVATTSPTQLSAAFRTWRIPRGVTVSTSVMLRFLPLVATEATAVLDAMRLRGLTGARGMLRHPILAIERFTVPLIVSSLRVGEDLAASALLRGLGSPHRPTSMTPPRFTGRDAVFALVAAALAGASVLLPG